MKQSLLSVTFINEDRNRRWTYDNVFKLETGIRAVFISCAESDKNHMFSVLNSEFNKIEITVQDDVL